MQLGLRSYNAIQGKLEDMDQKEKLQNAVAILYRSILGREPDFDGMSGKIHRLLEGEDLADIILEIRNSPEAIERRGAGFTSDMIVNEDLRAYMQNGFPQIEGWCDSAVFKVVDTLSRSEINRVGGCLEIGVHHGKLFILLNQIIAEQFSSYAIDVFDQQQLNIDASGKGSREIFTGNLEKHDRHKGKNVSVIVGDSTDPATRIVEKVTPGSIRFCSVDGGHTVEHTINDLTLANQLISNEGIVILDDALNALWPGVLEGAGKFLMSRPTLVPVALGHNKLYLCKLSFRQHYLDLFSKVGIFSKSVDFWGNRILAQKNLMD